MPFSQRSLNVWAKMSYPEFRQLYENEKYKSLITYIERRVKIELIRIVGSTGRGADLFFSSRTKDVLSAYKKMINTANKWREKRTEISRYRPKPMLHEMLHDIVGFRLICVDDHAMEAVIRRLGQSPAITLGEGTEIYSNSLYAGKQIRTRHADFRRKSIKVKSKKSGYESINYEILLAGAMPTIEPGERSLGPIYDARVKDINAIFRRIEKSHTLYVGMFSIELQVRTFGQHIWASEEHGIRYKGNVDGTVQNKLNSAFLALKKKLDDVHGAVQSIRKLHRAGVTDALRFVGKSYGMGLRGVYYDLKPFAKYKVELENIHGRLASLTDSRDSQHFQKQLTEIVSFAIGLQNACDFNPFGLNELEEGAWGRQRVVLMMVAYIILFCDVRYRRSLITKLFDETLISEILGGSGAGEQSMRPEDVPAALYEYVQACDQRVSEKIPSSLSDTASANKQIIARRAAFQEVETLLGR